MKRNIILYLGTLATIFLLNACANDNSQQENNTSDSTGQQAQTLLENSDSIAINEADMPAPGEGTMTSKTNTPLSKQTIAVYKSKDGKEIKATYSFDKRGLGTVVLQGSGIQDLTLRQKKDDPMANSAFYSDGTHSWDADAHAATFTDGKNTIQYELKEAMQ